jgi:uncharacterized protein (TIRG00374 family)
MTQMEKLKKISGLLIPLLLTLIFLYLAFRNVNLKDAFILVGNVKVGWLLVFIVIFLFSHFVRAIRWKYIISSVKDDVKVLHLFGATMIGYGVNAVVPRLGEVYRAMFMGRWEKISRTSMFGTVIVERIIDILALAFSVLVSVLIYSGNLYSKVSWLKSTLEIVFVAISLGIILILLTIIFKEKFYSVILKITSVFSETLAEKLGEIFSMLVEGFGSLKGKKNVIMTILLSIVIMLLYGLNSYISFLMMGMDQMQKVTFGMAWILMTISAFGVVIPTPSGIGSYHWITITTLVAVFGFDKEISSAFAIVTHAVSYIIFILSPFVFVYLVNLKRKGEGEEKLNFFTVLKQVKYENEKD